MLAGLHAIKRLLKLKIVVIGVTAHAMCCMSNSAWFSPRNIELQGLARCQTKTLQLQVLSDQHFGLQSLGLRAFGSVKLLTCNTLQDTMLFEARQWLRQLSAIPACLDKIPSSQYRSSALFQSAAETQLKKVLQHHLLIFKMLCGKFE